MLETLKDILAFGGGKRSVWKNFWERITWVQHLNYFFLPLTFQTVPAYYRTPVQGQSVLKDAPTIVLAVLEGTQDRI